jgi:hypothetical protein
MSNILEVDLIPRPQCECATDQLSEQLFGREPDGNSVQGARIFNPPAETPALAPEKALATSVLKQAAHDLRRFDAATTGVGRELYLDPYNWITANDFSWPYSFVNVCRLLHLCPEFVRMELLADASLRWLGYWIRRVGRFGRALRTSFVTPSPAPTKTVLIRSIGTRHLLLIKQLGTRFDKPRRHIWERFIRRPRNHNPLLVYTMVAFNFDRGWKKLVFQMSGAKYINTAIGHRGSTRPFNSNST